MIVAIKFLHIAALAIWCAGLVGLPLLLAKHAPDDEQEDFSRLRLLTHNAYIRVVTPAAVIAIAMGTALIFLRDAFVPWMFAKLVLVGLLVLVHGWLGHITVSIGEHQGDYAPRPAWPPLAASLASMTVILGLVLGKPLITEKLAPDWLNEPQGQPLPVDEVPM
ncbi:CopD family protein [Sphingomonas sp. 3-13AW]|uniref:CopD family protein n=1 Tax=Sphingomonas sp. 3-13AW TaxID=3050450 RepID=UPI003BB5B691